MRKSWFTAALADDDPKTAEVSIYDEIGAWGIDAIGFRDALAQLGAVDQINVSINSPGGSVFDGIAIHNMLQKNPAKVTVTVDGLAASIASLVAMAGDEVRMPENAMMMVHNPAAVMLGVYDAADMRAEADALDKIAASMVTSYTGKTGLPADEVQALLDATTWLSAQEAKDKGFADTVLPRKEMQAKFDLARFPAAPEAAMALLKGDAQAAAPDWTVGAARDLTVDESAAWDGAAAAERMLDAAGFNGDSPDSAKARRGFLVYDAANPDLKGSYKLPFADLIGGELKAVRAGIDNAASRLPQTDISQDVQDRARAVIDGYAKPDDDDASASAANDNAAAAATAAERERAQQIAAACQIARQPDKATGFIAAGKSLAEVLAELQKHPAAAAAPEISARHAPSAKSEAASWDKVIEARNKAIGG